MQERLLYIFGRAPIPRQTKTRLIPRLGQEGAAALYGAMLADVCRMTRALSCERILSVSTWPPHPWIVELAAQEQLALAAQGQGDLGTRMAGALRDGLVRSERVCIIGSDSPLLEPAAIAQAFARLDQADVVLGPAEDGGYWLLGARCPLDTVLAQTQWSTAAVFATTHGRAVSAGLRVALADPHWDVDEPADLDRLMAALASRPAQAPRTRAELAARCATVTGPA